jgi:hypothetical protein
MTRTSMAPDARTSLAQDARTSMAQYRDAPDRTSGRWGESGSSGIGPCYDLPRGTAPPSSPPGRSQRPAPRLRRSSRGIRRGRRGRGVEVRRSRCLGTLRPAALGTKDVVSTSKSTVFSGVYSKRNRVVGIAWGIDPHPQKPPRKSKGITPKSQDPGESSVPCRPDRQLPGGGAYLRESGASGGRLPTR